MIKIIFLARLRELIDISELSIELAKHQVSTVETVITMLAEQYPAFRDYLNDENPLLIAVNQEITGTEREIHSGDELAFFPPVTGG